MSLRSPLLLILGLEITTAAVVSLYIILYVIQGIFLLCTANSSFFVTHSPDRSSLSGKRIVLFSYGSGLASSMYSVRASSDVSPGSALDKLYQSLADLQDRLAARSKIAPEEFERIMKLREDTHHLGERALEPLVKDYKLDYIFPVFCMML